MHLKSKKPILASILYALKTSGFTGLLDSSLYFITRILRRTFYRWKGDAFGFQEAFLWGKHLDKWHRYNAVLQKINCTASASAKINSILEVGCGKEGLVEFHPLIKGVESCRIISMDIAAEASKYNPPFSLQVIGDGCRTPLGDDKVDFIVSVDSLEHIPKHNRQAYINELIRVARKGVFIVCPIQSNDGIYAGSKYDMKYQAWYLKYFGRPNITVSEHIELGVPHVDEILEILPDAEVRGCINGDIWLECMTLSSRPIIGFITGFWYLFFLRKSSNRPPYYNGIIYVPVLSKII